MSDLRPQLEAAIDFGQQQLRRLLESHPGVFPVLTDHGHWKEDAAARESVAGLVPGMVALLIESGRASDLAWWEERTRQCIAAIAPIVQQPANRDFGLNFFHGLLRCASVWKDSAATESMILRAGVLLAMRFEPGGQYLRSIDEPHCLRIETMMEVPLLLHVAEQLRKCPDQILPQATDWLPPGLNAHEIHRRAMQHSLTTIRTLCRADGSAAQEAIFNPQTGEHVGFATRHGYRGDSCRAQSLAAALHGFVTCFGLTRDRRFGKIAEDHAEFWLTNTPASGVPPWDFDAPLKGQFTLLQPDSTAAAIAASALLRLAELTPDRLRAQVFEQSALMTLQTLSRPPFLASDDPAWEGILRRGVHDLPSSQGVDESTLLGDFFFLDAAVAALRWA